MEGHAQPLAPASACGSRVFGLVHVPDVNCNHLIKPTIPFRTSRPTRAQPVEQFDDDSGFPNTIAVPRPFLQYLLQLAHAGQSTTADNQPTAHPSPSTSAPPPESLTSSTLLGASIVSLPPSYSPAPTFPTPQPFQHVSPDELDGLSKALQDFTSLVTEYSFQTYTSHDGTPSEAASNFLRWIKESPSATQPIQWRKQLAMALQGFRDAFDINSKTNAAELDKAHRTSAALSQELEVLRAKIIALQQQATKDVEAERRAHEQTSQRLTELEQQNRFLQDHVVSISSSLDRFATQNKTLEDVIAKQSALESSIKHGFHSVSKELAGHGHSWSTAAQSHHQTQLATLKAVHDKVEICLQNTEASAIEKSQSTLHSKLNQTIQQLEGIDGTLSYACSRIDEVKDQHSTSLSQFNNLSGQLESIQARTASLVTIEDNRASESRIQSTITSSIEDASIKADLEHVANEIKVLDGKLSSMAKSDALKSGIQSLSDKLNEFLVKVDESYSRNVAKSQESSESKLDQTLQKLQGLDETLSYACSRIDEVKDSHASTPSQLVTLSGQLNAIQARTSLLPTNDDHRAVETRYHNLITSMAEGHSVKADVRRILEQITTVENKLNHLNVSDRLDSDFKTLHDKLDHYVQKAEYDVLENTSRSQVPLQEKYDQTLKKLETVAETLSYACSRIDEVKDLHTGSSSQLGSISNRLDDLKALTFCATVDDIRAVQTRLNDLVTSTAQESSTTKTEIKNVLVEISKIDSKLDQSTEAAKSSSGLDVIKAELRDIRADLSTNGVEVKGLADTLQHITQSSSNTDVGLKNVREELQQLGGSVSADIKSLDGTINSSFKGQLKSIEDLIRPASALTPEVILETVRPLHETTYSNIGKLEDHIKDIISKQTHGTESINGLASLIRNLEEHSSKEQTLKSLHDRFAAIELGNQGATKHDGLAELKLLVANISEKIQEVKSELNGVNHSVSGLEKQSDDQSAKTLLEILEISRNHSQNTNSLLSRIDIVDSNFEQLSTQSENRHKDLHGMISGILEQGSGIKDAVADVQGRLGSHAQQDTVTNILSLLESAAANQKEQHVGLEKQCTDISKHLDSMASSNRADKDHLAKLDDIAASVSNVEKQLKDSTTLVKLEQLHDSLASVREEFSRPNPQLATIVDSVNKLHITNDTLSESLKSSTKTSSETVISKVDARFDSITATLANVSRDTVQVQQATNAVKEQLDSISTGALKQLSETGGAIKTSVDAGLSGLHAELAPRLDRLFSPLETLQKELSNLNEIVISKEDHEESITSLSFSFQAILNLIREQEIQNNFDILLARIQELKQKEEGVASTTNSQMIELQGLHQDFASQTQVLQEKLSSVSEKLDALPTKSESEGKVQDIIAILSRLQDRDSTLLQSASRLAELVNMQTAANSQSEVINEHMISVKEQLSAIISQSSQVQAFLSTTKEYSEHQTMINDRLEELTLLLKDNIKSEQVWNGFEETLSSLRADLGQFGNSQLELINSSRAISEQFTELVNKRQLLTTGEEMGTPSLVLRPGTPSNSCIHKDEEFKSLMERWERQLENMSRLQHLLDERLFKPWHMQSLESHVLPEPDSQQGYFNPDHHPSSGVIHTVSSPNRRPAEIKVIENRPPRPQSPARSHASVSGRRFPSVNDSTRPESSDGADDKDSNHSRPRKSSLKHQSRDFSNPFGSLFGLGGNSPKGSSTGEPDHIIYGMREPRRRVQSHSSHNEPEATPSKGKQTIAFGGYPSGGIAGALISTVSEKHNLETPEQDKRRTRTISRLFKRSSTHQRRPSDAPSEASKPQEPVNTGNGQTDGPKDSSGEAGKEKGAKPKSDLKTPPTHDSMAMHF